VEFGVRMLNPCLVQKFYGTEPSRTIPLPVLVINAAP